MAPTAPRREVIQKPSAAASTTASTTTVDQGTPGREGGTPAGAAGGVVVRRVMVELDSVWGGGGPSLARAATGGTPVLGSRGAGYPCYGVISQPNIMAWSSWARLWQCPTYFPTKS